MSRKHPETRYVIVRQVAQYPAVADTWTVVYYRTNENLSHHESEGEARAAVKRYKQADQRRARQARPIGVLAPCGALADFINEPPQPVDDGSCDPLYGQRMDSADCGEN
jgi:hypothetical protein